jgi:holo-[acyl-carrier protein] synthase
MVVQNLPTGQPIMLLKGGAKARLDSLTPAGMVAKVDVSQTDEYPMAHAMVIISAIDPALAPDPQ